MAETTTRPTRLLALDPGERRTGVAASDALGLFAHPRAAIHHDDLGHLLDAVVALYDAEPFDELVVGLPLTLAGADSDQTRTVRSLVASLRGRLPIPVTEWDERLSTKEAGRTVRGRSRRARGELDSAAAAVVLQAVLDSRRGSLER